MACIDILIRFDLAIRTLLGDCVIKQFTLKKLECFKQAICWNTLAWNNRKGPIFVILLVFMTVGND